MDSTNTLPQISPSQAQKEVVSNELFAAASPAMLFGRNGFGSGGLTWGYLGGRWGTVLVPNGSLTLPSQSTSQLVVDRATGEVSISAGSPGAWSDFDNYARLYVVTTGQSAVTAYEDHRGAFGGALGSGQATSTEDPTPEVVQASFQLSCSDLATAITASAGKAYFRLPHALTLTAVRASLFVAQASGSIFTVDVNVGGTSLLITKLTVDNTEKTSATAAAPAVISVTSLSDDAEVSIDVDQVGDGTAKGLIVTLIGTRVAS